MPGRLLPGGIGGDALRVAFVVGKGASLSTVVAAVLLTGCGSTVIVSAPSGPSGTPTADTSTVGINSFTPGTFDPNSSESQKSADDIFNNAMQQLGSATSVHIVGTTTDPSASNSTSVFDFTQTTARLTVTLTSTGQITIVVVADGQAWQEIGGGWVPQTGDQLAQDLAALPPKSASCALQAHGVLTKGASSMINGTPSIEIKDDGLAPGDAPNSTFVATTGPPRVLRIIQNGTTSAGGDPTCGAATTTDTTTFQQLDFDYSRSAPDITPPAEPAPTAG